MGMMIVRQRVRDFFDWHKVFDRSRRARGARGISAERIYRGTHDGNDLVVVMNVGDVDNARSYAGSPIRRQILEAGDVIGEPAECFVDEAPSGATRWRETT